MFSISIKVEIPDLDKHSIEVPCPACRLHTWVRLGEIRRRDFAVCRGCHANLLLEDHLGGLHRFTRSLSGMFENIGE
jgi:hypothetical protein